MNWVRIYQNEGVTGLYDKRNGGNAAKLSNEQIEHLQSQVHQYSPKQLFSQEEYVGTGEYWGVPTLAKLVERNYGVVYASPNSYRNLFKRCGLSLQKPATEYKSRSLWKVMDFEEALEKNESIRHKNARKPCSLRKMKPPFISRQRPKSSGIHVDRHRWFVLLLIVIMFISMAHSTFTRANSLR